MNGGELRTEGRVAELVNRHQSTLEQIFLNIIEYKAAA
jgi:hypothetical protein